MCLCASSKGRISSGKNPVCLANGGEGGAHHNRLPPSATKTKKLLKVRLHARLYIDFGRDIVSWSVTKSVQILSIFPNSNPHNSN